MRKRLLDVIAVSSAVIGLLVMHYPVVATVLTALDTADATRAETVTVGDTTGLIRDAEKFNKRLQAEPVLDPWLNKVRSPANKRYMEYMSTMNMGNGLMAELLIPVIGVKLPVYHDTTDNVLEKGAGHLFGSHLPVGGDGMMSVIAAHRGLPNATMFDRLPELRKGDRAVIIAGSMKHVYKVVDSNTVLPSDVHSLHATPGADRLVLVTCTPYGVNTHRLLVEFERDLTAERSIDDSDLAVPWFKRLPNWVWAAAVFDIIVINGVAIVTAARKRRKHSSEVN